MEDSNEKPGISKPAEPESKTKRDFYAILGVEKDATEKQIATAYKKLALKFHPDRNQGSPEAAEKFKEISTAYAVLSDPNKRRQYDVMGDDAADSEFQSVDVEEMGGMGRMFGAMMNKLGIPIPTSISQATLTKSYEVMRNGNLQTDPDVQPLEIGRTYNGSVERQQAIFFRLNVTEQQSKDGIVMMCTSSNKSRFKLVLFDNQGSVRFQDESSAYGKKATAAFLYFTPFQTSVLKPPFPDLTRASDPLPPVFQQFENFITTAPRSIEAGSHLICLYGDNFLRSAQYSFKVVAAVTTEGLVGALTSKDDDINRKKEELLVLQEEFTRIKEQFEGVVAKVQEQTNRSKEMEEGRYAAYEEFLAASLDSCRPPDADVNTKKKKSLFGFI
mmetsp:Transcript_15467/g.22758  ORF Transcript_15467/g.22758 Transcript_15467/m.22758 type:complete len:387 (-) Transcript_15467:224-1384(-)